MTATKSYHHGNLRQALIGAAIKSVETHGHEQLSLRELAQTVDVSPGAPYRHFEDRLTLLAAVAEEGCRDLDARRAEAVGKVADPRERLYIHCKVLLAFANEREALFNLMFDPQLLGEIERFPGYKAASDKTYNVIVDAFLEILPEADKKAVRAHVLIMWATLYGFIKMRHNRTALAIMIGDLTPEEAEDAAIAAAMGALAPLRIQKRSVLLQDRIRP